MTDEQFNKLIEKLEKIDDALFYIFILIVLCAFVLAIVIGGIENGLQ